MMIYLDRDKPQGTRNLDTHELALLIHARRLCNTKGRVWRSAHTALYNTN
jgi:hypothetical protein